MTLLVFLGTAVLLQPATFMCLPTDLFPLIMLRVHVQRRRSLRAWPRCCRAGSARSALTSRTAWRQFSCRRVHLLAIALAHN